MLTHGRASAGVGRKALAALAGLLAAACGPRPPAGTSVEPAQTRGTPAPAAARPRLVCLGDSLTSGYGLAPHEAFPALLQHKLHAAGYDLEVVNAGVSGDTSAAGLARLEHALVGEVRLALVALGANDGLRGLPLQALERNLDEIVRRCQERGVRVLLAGMEVPTSLGPGYAAEFRAVFRRVAERRRTAWLPFLLSGVAGDPRLNQGDSIHPNALGTRLVAENVWQALRPLLDAPGMGRP